MPANPASKSCPVGHHTAPLTFDDTGTCHVYGHQAAKAVLQAGDTQQAGFMAEQFEQMQKSMRPPILFLEGEAHREQRAKTARFFTPTTTDQKYRPLIEPLSGALIAELRTQGRADVCTLSERLAVAVAAHVVGMTNSPDDDIARRIATFFRHEEPVRGPRQWGRVLRAQLQTLNFYLKDVRPALRARRKSPQDDVISHLLAQGYKPLEILTECVTYAVAGMSTTREFISMAAWHLLERPELRARYLHAEEPERHAILQEILRLEPVIGEVRRQTTHDLTLTGEDGVQTIPAGTRIHVHVYDANTDERAVGACPHTLHPQRETAAGVRPAGLSFGHGPHACPGAFVALHESDVFLRGLLALETLRVVQPPQLGRNEVTHGYELRDFIVTA